jgi:hypothetical protein
MNAGDFRLQQEDVGVEVSVGNQLGDFTKERSSAKDEQVDNIIPTIFFV